jgi:hypothetical protein
MHKYAGSAICDFSGGMQHGAVSFDVWMDCQPFFFLFHLCVCCYCWCPVRVVLTYSLFYIKKRNVLLFSGTSWCRLVSSARIIERLNNSNCNLFGEEALRTLTLQLYGGRVDEPTMAELRSHHGDHYVESGTETFTYYRCRQFHPLPTPSCARSH